MLMTFAWPRISEKKTKVACELVIPWFRPMKDGITYWPLLGTWVTKMKGMGCGRRLIDRIKLS